MASKLVHWEIMGPNATALTSFYGDLFGWEFDSPPGFGDYHLVSDEQAGIGGAVGKGDEQMPNYVTLYLAVPDINAHLARIESHGGKTLVPRTVIPDTVIFAMFSDPAGNVVGLVEDM
jgi:predicted enzyme related to lactoylglutathione lyase